MELTGNGYKMANEHRFQMDADARVAKVKDSMDCSMVTLLQPSEST